MSTLFSLSNHEWLLQEFLSDFLRDLEYGCEEANLLLK